MRVSSVVRNSLAFAAVVMLPVVGIADNERTDKQGVDNKRNESQMQGTHGSLERDRTSGDTTRARMSETSEEYADARDEVREVVQDMVASAINGDLEDFVDYLSERDRERMERERSAGEIQALSNTFANRWEERYNRSFEEGLEEATLPVRVSNVSDSTARATIGEGSEQVTLRLVKGGWFNTAWRIDAPDTLSLAALRSNLQGAVQRIESSGTSQSEREALKKAAVEVLKPVGSAS